MRLKCKKMCPECKVSTIQEWKGIVEEGQWSFKCTECGTSYATWGPENITWLTENEE